MGLCGSYGVGQYSSVAAEAHQAMWARAYRPAGVARPVLWFHSAGAGSVGVAAEEPWIQSNNSLPLLSAVAALGLPILSADTGGGGSSGATHWGNDTAQARVNDMRAFAQSNVYLKASADKVVLMGVSMGGLLALNWAKSNPTLTQAIVLFYPAVNLQAIHDGTGGAGNGATTVETAYGGSLAAFNAAEPTHDPAYPGVPPTYQQFPIYMAYSDSDTTVGAANQTAWVAAVGGSNLRTRVYPGAGHADMTKVSPSEVYSFLAPYV